MTDSDRRAACAVPAGTASELLREVKDGIATVTFNRPGVYNAYSTESLAEFARAVRSASHDDSVDVIVITGAGTRAFCTGGDVREYAEKYTRRPHDYWKYMNLFRDAVECLLRAGKPTIARINGLAVGGGNEINLACDLSIAADHAVLGQVGTSVGSVACGGATQWLPITVGAKRAAEMLLLNPKLTARQALQWGLVNEVVPSVRRNGGWIESATPEEIRLAQAGEQGYRIDLESLDRRVAAIAEALRKTFPECTRYTRQQFNFWKELAWFQTVGHGADWLALHFACVEPREGMTAFVEKRKPDVAGLRRRLASGDHPDWVWGPYSASCSSCGARRLPEGFRYCGACGREL